MTNTDTMLMPGARALGVEINSEERNYLARHVSRVLDEQRTLLATADDFKAATNCFKKIAVMVNIAADIGWEFEVGGGARFDLVTVPKGQLVVWVRRFKAADRETIAFYAGVDPARVRHLEMRSTVAVALWDQIGLALRLQEALGDVERDVVAPRDLEDIPF